MCYKREVEVATEAALQAGKLIQFHAGRLSEAAIQYKGVHNLVTFVDTEAQQLIFDVLQNAFPTYGFLAEEETDQTTPSHQTHRWIIDPIDGTTNFAHGLPPYAVSIGLEVLGEPVAGVVFDVSSGDLFTAWKGNGMYVNGVRHKVRQQKNLSQSLITTGFPYREFHYLEDYLSVLSNFMRASQGVRRPGASSVDLAWLASGKFDGFFELGLAPWDVAAGCVLVQEAGGIVTDFEGGNDFLFGGQMLASNGLIHDEMLAIAQPLKKYKVQHSNTL